MADYSLGAQILFEELQKLDPHEGARRELRAAGVVDSQIESLYPSGFDGIALGLAEKMEELRASAFETIMNLLGKTREVLNATEAVRAGALTLQKYVYLGLAANCEIESASDGWKAIKAVLIKRGVGGEGSFEFSASIVAEVLWCTYTFMMQHETLRPEHQALTDEIMVSVGIALGLFEAKEGALRGLIF